MQWIIMRSDGPVTEYWAGYDSDEQWVTDIDEAESFDDDREPDEIAAELREETGRPAALSFVRD